MDNQENGVVPPSTVGHRHLESSISPELMNITQNNVGSSMGDKKEESSEIHVAIPSYSSWFSMGRVHDIEKSGFPDMFYEGADVRLGEIYVEYRNFMVESFRKNSGEYLTITASRRHLSGDVGRIIRIHSFLEQWGLINYQIADSLRPGSIMSGNTQKSRIFAKTANTLQSIGGEDKVSNVQLQHDKEDISVIYEKDLNIYGRDFMETVEGSNSIPVVNCTECGIICRPEYYHCIKSPGLNLCKLCFSQGRFSSSYFSSDFVLLDGNMKDPSSWTDEEQLYLLEGIEMYNEDWDKISSHVGTKTKEECIQKFVEIPIAESIHNSSSSLPVSIASENPIMSIVSFLASMVHPNVAYAAAKSAMGEYEKICSEKNSNNAEFDTATPFGSDFSDPNLLENVSKAILESASEASTALIKEEDEKIKGYISIVTESYIRKIELKMKQFKLLEEYVENEKKEVERQKALVYEERMKLQKAIKEVLDGRGIEQEEKHQD